MPGGLLCRRCDVYVGYGAAGIIEAPDGRDRAWLADHCWSCGRSRDQVQADPRGRPGVVGSPDP